MPFPVSLRNPVIPGFHPDPSLCRVGDDFWLATSSFEYFPGLPIFHSRDLINWRLAGHALHHPEQINLRGRDSSKGIFAPTLRYHDGIFYLVATDVSGIGNFILTATDPAGPWSNPIRVQDGEGFTWFDPSLLFDDDGKVYYTRRHEFSIVQAEINPSTGVLTTPLHKIHDQYTSDDIEGPHLYHIDGWYYLLCAEGGTGWGHALSIGRARNPSGPFEHCPHNPILTHRHLCNHYVRCTGHGDFVQIKDGSWWLLLLATRHPYEDGFPFHHMGRETFLAPVEWVNGWPLINQGNPIDYTVTAPNLPNHPWSNLPKSDDFQTPILDPRWTFRREPMSDNVKIKEGTGLEILGLPATLDENAPLAWLGQRLVQPDVTISTQLHFAPIQDDQEAGLTLYLSEDFHAEIALQRRSGKLCIVAKQRAATLHNELAVQPYNHETVVLQICGNWNNITLLAGPDEDKLKAIAVVDRRLLCTEVAAGWTGCFAALYATGNGRPSDIPARFSFFKHHAFPIGHPQLHPPEDLAFIQDLKSSMRR